MQLRPVNQNFNFFCLWSIGRGRSCVFPLCSLFPNGKAVIRINESNHIENSVQSPFASSAEGSVHGFVLCIRISPQQLVTGHLNSFKLVIIRLVKLTSVAIGVPQINQTTFAGASRGFLCHLPVINKRSYLISNMLLNQISGADVSAHYVEGHQPCLYFVSTCDRRPPDAEA
jgi:hypothetical protein